MRAHARFRGPDGGLVDLGPGDIIGRLPTAALRINDPRVSEAHALVSLRAGALKLLALRGRFLVDGAPQTEVTLASGLVVELAHGLPLTVLAIVLPSAVVAIEGPGVPRQLLPPVASFVARSREVVPGFSPDADATLWFDGEGFRARVRGLDGDQALEPESILTIDGVELRVVAVRLDHAGAPVTQRDELFDAPLALTLRYESVHVERGPDHLTIDGVPAMIMTELGQIGAPVEWRVVARELWPEEDDDQALRQRWDRGLARLRARLRELGLRADLVRLVGGGRVELYLHPHDRLRDAT
ncbi:MAG: FHA domain-containing protein [Deltaproteobacteria bacterium]|nr:FHA domain-containing protein [Deltaproteobacteria bacterium]